MLTGGCDAHAIKKFAFDCYTQFREGRAYVEDDKRAEHPAACLLTQ